MKDRWIKAIQQFSWCLYLATKYLVIYNGQDVEPLLLKSYFQPHVVSTLYFSNCQIIPNTL